MNLLGHLCELLKYEPTEEGLYATVRLNVSHSVFAGHFPGHPLMPGVIQMQLVDELLRYHLGKQVGLVALDHCKFVRVLDPRHTPVLAFNLKVHYDQEFIVLTATGETKEGTFMKLKGQYRSVAT